MSDISSSLVQNVCQDIFYLIKPWCEIYCIIVFKRSQNMNKWRGRVAVAETDFYIFIYAFITFI